MRGTRVFFIVCLVVSAVFTFALVGGMAGAHPLSPEAALGRDVWEARGCAGCHTLYGAGGPYAPDLTHIYSQRGADYLTEFLANPAAFHPGQRLMPSFGLTKSEVEYTLDYLQWADAGAATWPPRPIAVSGNSVSVAQAGAGTPGAASDPAAAGKALFSRFCATCHSLQPDVVIVGPSLAGVASRAASRVPGKTAEEYLRTSIVYPGDFVVPGFQNVMQKNFGDVLTVEQIDSLIAFLMAQQ
jgi:nitric oxide reductase subunit C